MKAGDLVRISGGGDESLCLILRITSGSAFIITENGPRTTVMCEVLMLKSERICTFPASYLTLLEAAAEIEEE